jgi:DNA-binding NarL/FixJ family response regulator
MVLKAIVLSTTGTPRQELLAFLKSVAGLELLEDGVYGSAVEPPELIILDASAQGSDPVTELRTLKAQLPDVLTIVLISSPRRSIMAWGADRVLLTGFSALEFCQALEGLGD